MENAVQALLIVAGVLIGVMILSLGVSLYSSLNGFVEETQQEIINREVQKFNEQFSKYINCETETSEVDFQLTIQDIVTAANIAHENNLEYGLTGQTDNNYYVTINIKQKYPNLEQTINSETTTILDSEILEKEIGKQYRCQRKDVKINPTTGRVYEVTFIEIEE